ncbi:hypothetical protein M427DRAFT_63385 [Gonapodya prolifera JEL478]|uniref:Uncharacterized protein n=1 Tax=Gonapodya prolifera (strain JEL478) TaxID=1344416 RepID=A0A138ZZ99_GONPJ|nr:hypothetical protein M427DRAFT_63385 [Gonapodya prolifera JEL478]|eukprot:KXS09836.1 hypothetical protein M427DRAFT_63385 [Gonapodya prolifera JEL478]
MRETVSRATAASKVSPLLGRLSTPPLRILPILIRPLFTPDPIFRHLPKHITSKNLERPLYDQEIRVLLWRNYRRPLRSTSLLEPFLVNDPVMRHVKKDILLLLGFLVLPSDCRLPTDAGPGGLVQPFRDVLEHPTFWYPQGIYSTQCKKSCFDVGALRVRGQHRSVLCHP